MQFEFLFDRDRVRQPENEWLRVGPRHVRLWFARHPRARRYVLRLCSDGTARVTIPRGGCWAEARRFANRNLGWLEKQLLRQAKRPCGPKEWTAGTEILFRGEKVRLEVSEAERVVRFGGEAARLPQKPRTSRREKYPNSAMEQHDANELPKGVPFPHRMGRGIKGEGFVSWQAPFSFSASVRGSILDASSIFVSPTAAVDLRSSIEKHLWHLASGELPLRVAELAREHGFHVRRVTVRNQRSRWGSCSKRGTISLNWRLIQTPLFVRDYIILHELAHLKEMNHSRRFWREVARLCPDFARAERWLKDHSNLFR